MAPITHVHDVANATVQDYSLDGDIMDAGMRSLNPDTNYGDATNPMIGLLNCQAKVCDGYRMLCFYDLAQIIPASATITAAAWWIYVNGIWPWTSGDDLEITAFRLRRQDWVESEATWNNYKAGTPWTAPGAGSIVDDRDTGVKDVFTGFGAGVNEAGGSCDTDDTWAEDLGQAWDVDEWVGFTVDCYSKRMVITSNTATRVYGTGWTGGGNPGDGHPYTILRLGWWDLNIINIVQDAYQNQGGLVHFVSEWSAGAIGENAWILYFSKEYDPPPTYYLSPHLRVTYTLDGRTFQAFIFNNGLPGFVVLQGSAVGVSGMTGSLAMTWALAGSLAGAGGMAGLLGLDLPLAGTAAGQSGVIGTLSTGAIVLLQGSAAGISGVDGLMVLTLGLAGAAGGVAGADGLLGLDLPLAGTIAAQGGAVGVLALNVGLAGTAAGISTVAGALVLDVALAGVVNGQATVTATMTVIEAIGAILQNTGVISLAPVDAATIALAAVRDAVISLGPAADLVISLTPSAAATVDLRLADGRTITLDPERAATVALAAVLAGTATLRTAVDGVVSIQAVITDSLALALADAGIISLKPTDEGGF